MSEHLDYGEINDTQKIWADFLNTGILKEPSTEDVPGDFICDDEIYRKLKGTIKSINCKNWYAYYHLGILEFRKGNDKIAKEMYETSLKLRENAWALHGLACLSIHEGNKNLAALYAQRGMELKRHCLSYQKEGLKILSQCEAYRAILQQYAVMDEDMKSIGRVQYYYALGLVKTGRLEEADKLLNSEEGIVVDDVREGEDSIQDLWEILNHELYGGKQILPFRYEFHAN